MESLRQCNKSSKIHHKAGEVVQSSQPVRIIKHFLPGRGMWELTIPGLLFNPVPQQVPYLLLLRSNSLKFRHDQNFTLPGVAKAAHKTNPECSLQWKFGQVWTNKKTAILLPHRLSGSWSPFARAQFIQEFSLRQTGF